MTSSWSNKQGYFFLHESHKQKMELEKVWPRIFKCRLQVAIRIIRFLFIAI